MGQYHGSIDADQAGMRFKHAHNVVVHLSPGRPCTRIDVRNVINAAADLLWFKAGAPRTEHYQLVRTLSADAVVTVL